jgi:hypothetical protein
MAVIMIVLKTVIIIVRLHVRAIAPVRVIKYVTVRVQMTVELDVKVVAEEIVWEPV